MYDSIETKFQLLCLVCYQLVCRTSMLIINESPKYLYFQTSNQARIQQVNHFDSQLNASRNNRAVHDSLKD